MLPAVAKNRRCNVDASATSYETHDYDEYVEVHLSKNASISACFCSHG